MSVPYFFGQREYYAMVGRIILRVPKKDVVMKPSPFEHLEHPTAELFENSPQGVFLFTSLIGGVVLAAGSYVLFSPDIHILSVALGLLWYSVFVLWARTRLVQDYPHSVLGLCNIVTLGRLVIAGILSVALLAGVPPSWATCVLAVFALSLDGLDGWLARRDGLCSDFGARLDMEVDAAFALVLAVFAALNGAAGLYVILLGVPYYLFGAAKAVLPWLDRPLEQKFSRKTVCVAQIATLIALQVPFLADGGLDLVVVAVTMALLWSFGRDILWLWRCSK